MKPAPSGGPPRPHYQACPNSPSCYKGGIIVKDVLNTSMTVPLAFYTGRQTTYVLQSSVSSPVHVGSC